MMTIDSHLHLWSRTTSEYAWLSGELERDFLPAEAEAELLRAGVDSAILVQAEDSAADTRFLLDTAAAHPWVMGVVGWVPLDDSARAARLLDEWTASTAFRGVRQLIHTGTRAGILSAPEVRETLAVVSERGLAFDVPDGWPHHLRDVAPLADALPQLTIVIDHLAKPPSGDEEFDAWEQQLRSVAARPNAVAKVSGLQGLPAAVVDRAWDIALDAFGPTRLMFGGDWPMTVPYGGYGAAISALDGLITTLSTDEQESLRIRTARAAYRLEPRMSTWL